ncbi:hypothetical protein B7435_23860 [Mycolicibacterium peregrinum]|uniref:sensor domain-containing protein n=1 Tax=Mycolicibacterium peregrinum TaxID=43304 RepID=UPI000B4B96A7|nr:sensor domain-containing protein [Mycolicibacterium peregrinum]OWL98796.1 hypothetical protein B7435_23860 [Mycolicibacterium peregrinum]
MTGRGGYEHSEDFEQTLQYGQVYQQHPNWTPPPSPGAPQALPQQQTPQWQATSTPWPPASSPAAPTPRRGGRGAWLGAGAAVVLAVAAVGAVVIQMRGGDQSTNAAPAAAPNSTPAAADQQSTSAPAPAAAAVSSQDLPGLLPTASELSDMLLLGKLSLVNDAALPYGDTSDQEDCGSVAAPGLHQGYDGSGYTAMRVQDLYDGTPDTFSVSVSQAVATFPDDQKAQEFVRTESGRWAQCKYKSVTLRYPGVADKVWQIRNPSFTDGVLTVSMSGFPGGGCQHTLTSARNVAIDVRICTDRGSAQAPQLAAKIAERVPAA